MEIYELELEFSTYSDYPDNPNCPIDVAWWEAHSTVLTDTHKFEFCFGSFSSHFYVSEKLPDGSYEMVERIELDGYIPSQLEEKIASFNEAKLNGFR